MARRKNLINNPLGKKYTKKQVRKLHDGKCFFCGEDRYELLDAHRLFEGSEGGGYDWINMASVCVMCHRKVHCGIIKILGNYASTKGRCIHFVDEDGQEKWKFN